MRRPGNSAGYFSQDTATVAQAVAQAIATAGATYSASDVAGLNAATQAFWAASSPAGLATVAALIPFASSAIACFELKKTLPIPSDLVPDGKGGCTVLGKLAPPPPAFQPVPQPTFAPPPVFKPASPPPAYQAEPQKPAPSTEPGISTNGGLLAGVLIAGAAVAIFALTLNQKPKGKSR